MEAEQAYSTAMAAAAKAAASGPLAAPADSAGLSKAVEGLVQLPAAAAAGHRQVYLELQVVVDSVRGLWRQYTTTAKDLKQAISTVRTWELDQLRSPYYRGLAAAVAGRR